jgi:phosphoglycolate phosphatase
VAPTAGPRPEPRLLLLFDIDGTLLQGATKAHAQALREAAAAVHGVAPLVGEVEVAGRTDQAIARDLLLAGGVTGANVDGAAAAVLRETLVAYERLVEDDLSAFVAPGVPELLAALAERPDDFKLSLVTGNIEPIAHLKLGRAGIGGFFPDGQGGFGSDSEHRSDLPAIARARASDPPWPRERTVVIGDTPRDIACARADEVRVAAVTTGMFRAEALADADAVVDDARALLPVLLDWL